MIVERTHIVPLKLVKTSSPAIVNNLFPAFFWIMTHFTLELKSQEKATFSQWRMVASTKARPEYKLWKEFNMCFRAGTTP